MKPLVMGDMRRSHRSAYWQAVRVGIDFIMAALLPCLMAYALIGEALHEWLGVAMIVMLALHHLLNWRWYQGLSKGAYTSSRVLRIVVNMLLLLAIMSLGASGMILSRYVLAAWKPKGGIAAARLVHLSASYWSFVLLSFHLGFYWARVAAGIKKAVRLGGFAPQYTIIVQIALLLYAAYGVFVLCKRQIVSYLFLRIHFAFYDYNEPVLWFFVDYIAMICLFAVIGHCLAQGVYRRHHRLT